MQCAIDHDADRRHHSGRRIRHRRLCRRRRHAEHDLGPKSATRTDRRTRAAWRLLRQGRSRCAAPAGTKGCPYHSGPRPGSRRNRPLRSAASVRFRVGRERQPRSGSPGSSVAVLLPQRARTVCGRTTRRSRRRTRRASRLLGLLSSSEARDAARIRHGTCLRRSPNDDQGASSNCLACSKWGDQGQEGPGPIDCLGDALLASSVGHACRPGFR